MTAVPARLPTGDEVHVSAVDGDAVTLTSPVAFAPGAPLVATALVDGIELALSVKCHGSKRGADGRFLVRGRPIGLTREARERWRAAIGEP